MDDNNSSATSPKKTSMLDAFSKALLEDEYQKILCKTQGSFAHMMVLLKTTENLSKESNL